MYNTIKIALIVFSSVLLFSPSLLAQELDNGLHLFFEDTQSQEISEILTLIAEDQELVYVVVEELNSFLELPVPIPILFGDCGQTNAFYLSEEQTIVICYEMIAQSYLVYASMGYEGEELSLAVGNNTISILLHEIGHALVDILELPITGREEDAVDQFSVMSLLIFEELGEEALVDFATFWAGMAEITESSLEDISFFGEHSLNSQRFYDILCLAYGASQEELEYIVDEDILPLQRAQGCPGEFERVLNAWDALLQPYYKN